MAWMYPNRRIIESTKGKNKKYIYNNNICATKTMMVEENHQGKGKTFTRALGIEKRSTTPLTTQTPNLSTYDNVSNRETSYFG